MLDKYIESLYKLLTQEIKDSTSLDVWKSSAINILTRIYGSNSSQENQINEIKYRISPSFGGIGKDGLSWSKGGNDNIDSCKQKAYSLTKSFIDELITFGLPEPKNNFALGHDRIHINLTQTQTQDVKINLNLIIHSFQDELSGKQLKEIQEIITDKNIKDNDKRNSIVDKLKSFGSDVMSNVLANILTNPETWKYFQ